MQQLLNSPEKADFRLPMLLELFLCQLLDTGPRGVVAVVPVFVRLAQGRVMASIRAGPCVLNGGEQLVTGSGSI